MVFEYQYIWTPADRPATGESWYCPSQDIRTPADGSRFQYPSDVRNRRRDGAPIPEALPRCRQANRLRPPGDDPARHAVQTVHAAQRALGRPPPCCLP